MDFLGERRVGAFLEEEIVQLGNLIKIAESGSTNEYVTTSLLRMLSSFVLKLNTFFVDSKKTRDLQLEEVVQAVNFLKSRVDDSNSRVQYLLAQVPEVKHTSDPVITMAELQNVKPKSSEDLKEIKEVPKEPMIKPIVFESDQDRLLKLVGTQTNMELLEKWTEKKRCEVIYDSDDDGLSSYSLNAKICGKKNVMIFVKTTDNCLFGTFNTVELPTPLSESEYCFVRNDAGFFIFSLENHKSSPQKICKKIDASSDASILIKSSMTDVFYVSKAFCVKNGGSFVLPGFSQEYVVEGESGDDTLTGTHDPQKFDVRKVLAVVWD
ncbi:hypothetical protein EIN_207220 [Entamoeba invadens IP1]|uniref:TLDc domain-containing protein n=1 Tax=Entamoeba invadens IP1 TaxID=370355 RepID=A0A0A1UD49_ENTIV|nr:hypothetical protein EIN_207220 [Entamoeba invadens IP1]ELP91675.1 hypothetical protein EIN_207220 [Entamoeba invadens IP1]|eukprot:XP_004258446.1 hypothetical protein EIN_207220 [Entamoeba invadens IP1]